MELKKNPKVDVNNKRSILLEIGLILALCIVIAAFLYTPREVVVEKIDMNYGPVEEQITEITRQEEQKPEPPKKTEITVITEKCLERSIREVIAELDDCEVISLIRVMEN